MISATMIEDSISPYNHRLTTLEVVMPRYILAEFNTHRMLSKNSASSRAISPEKMIKSVMETPYIPIAWQKTHKGMQGFEYITDPTLIQREIEFHLEDRDYAVISTKRRIDRGVTKQLANRLLEPFMYHKVLVSGTEWENFFNLRCPQYSYQSGEKFFKSRKDWTDQYEKDGGYKEDISKWTEVDWLFLNKGGADIHMMALAESIWDAMNESEPKKLREGDWHIPYRYHIEQLTSLALEYSENGVLIEDKELELTLKISAAMCARTSYTTIGEDGKVHTNEANLKLYEQLLKGGHMSPFEHIGRVMTEAEYNNNQLLSYSIGSYEETYGVSRNFRGFIQYRQLIEEKV